MRTRILLTVAIALAPMPMIAARAEEPTPPPAPAAPRTVPFSDQADGRHLLFSAYDAYHDAPILNYSVRWETERIEGTDRNTGMETVRARLGEDKMAISTETQTPKRSIRRAIASGGSLLSTSFEETSPKPTRTFVRLPLEASGSLRRAIAQVQFATKTKASEFLMAQDWQPRSGAIVYQSRTDGSAGDAVVVQIDPATGSDRAPTVVTHRYTIHEATHRLARYEEWTVTTPQQQPATGRASKNNRPRGTYRREDYSEAATIPADAFSQALPAGYQEHALPSVTLPPLPPNPKEADPEALALFRRWRLAQERLLTLGMDGTIQVRSEARTPESRTNDRQNLSAQFTLSLQRPGKARLTAVTAATPDKTLLVVSDGSQIRSNRDPRTVNAPPPGGQLWPRMRQVGDIQMQEDLLGWLIDVPPPVESFDKVALEERTTQDAPGTVAVLTLLRTNHNTNGRGRSFDTRVTWRVALGADDLPREIAVRRQMDTAGLMERDQLPILLTSLRIGRVSIDLEPSTNAFALPK